MVYRIVLQYDGSAFSGWQFQPAQRTIQAVVEAALATFFGGERISTHASGRTDAGVHALGQVVSFRTETLRDPDRLRMGLNTLLPKDVSCILAEHAVDGFHARKSAIGKVYRYHILNRRDRSPFLWGRAWWTRRKLDWAGMERAMGDYLGTHDYTSFRGPGCPERSPIRLLTRAEHVADGDNHLLTFEGPGFLRHQIRIMVGTLLEIGEGLRTAEAIPAILAAKNRSAAGRTASPDGLTLVAVRYPEGILGA